MNAFTLARRFLRWRAVATWLAILSIALAVGMSIALRSIPRAIGAGVVEPAVRFPVVIGRGESPTRIVLGVVYLEPPAPPSVPRTLVAKVAAAPGVAAVFPVSITHEGGLRVATRRSYFFQGQGRLDLSRGRFFEDRELDLAVVGSRAASDLRLELGDTVTRGASARVVGVLMPTGTPIDDAIFVPLQAEEQSVSAMVVVPGVGFDPDAVVRALGEPAVRVVPVQQTIRRLVRLVAAVERIVTWLSWAIAALTLTLVLSSFYSSVRERIRDLAVLRVLGARRMTVMLVLGCETAIVGAAGALIGIFVGRALLSVASAALATAGLAFTPRASENDFRVAFASALLFAIAGLAVAANAYRMDPVLALGGAHRPWPEVLGARGQAVFRRVRFAVLVALVVFWQSSAYQPSLSNRLPNDTSMRLFGLLHRWQGEGRPPSEVAALEGKSLEIEGYQYVPFEPGPTRRWRSRFFLVIDDPNRPVELFHDEHRPEVNERIAVELEEPIEAGLYPVRVSGTFTMKTTRTDVGEAIYHLVRARAKVLVLESD